MIRRTRHSSLMVVVLGVWVGCGQSIVGFPDGEPCTVDGDCASGRCLNGFCAGVTTTNEPPKVTIVSPLEGALYDVSDDVLVHAVIRDPDDDPATLVVTAVSNIDGLVQSGSPDTNGVFTFTRTFGTGNHLLEITAVDGDGDEGRASLNFVVSSTDPGDVDGDNDGFTPNQGDCDDSLASVNPGAPETCNNVDDDCDNDTDEGLSFDVDMDGHYALGSCLTPADDCDDEESRAFPGEIESCDGVDNDCDNSTDEGLSTDADGDGHYTVGSCLGPADDCDDSDDQRHPGLSEVCDGKDNDCTGLPDEGCVYCGNGSTDTGEECDNGLANSDIDADACRTNCTNPSCGDNVLDTGEDCDDGNNDAGDGCDAVCVKEPCILSGTRVGTITLAMSPCIVQADTTVPAGQSLNVEAGVVFKFEVGRGWPSSDRDIIVDGTLNLNGTVAAPIVFTSYYDDSVAGDTNGDGSATSPARGDWGRLRFQGTGGGVVSNLTMRYGGGGNTGACCTADPPTDATFSASVPVLPSIDGLVVELSQSKGAFIQVTGGFTTSVVNSTFRNNLGHGLELTAGNAVVDLNVLDVSGNGGDGLLATSSGPMTLGGSTASANGGRGFVLSTTGLLTLTGNISTGHVTTFGFDIVSARSDSSITLNQSSTNHTAFRTPPALAAEIVNNNTLLDTERGIVLRGGVVDVDTTWPEPGYVYVFEGDVRIIPGVALTLAAGVVIKSVVARGWPSNDGDLVVDGTLMADGTVALPIVFTSLYDDTIGGDTGVDGVATLPAPGDWGRIRFNGGSGGSLSELQLRFGGGGNTGACCTANPPTDASLSIGAADAPAIDAVLVEFSQSRGALLALTSGFTTTVTNSTFRNNFGTGLELSQGLGPLVLTGLVASNNGQNGMLITAGNAVDLTTVEVRDNGVTGITVSAGTVLTVNGATLTGHVAGFGLEVTGASPVSSITATTISGNDRVARVIPNIIPTLLAATNTLSDTARGLWVTGGTVTGSATWPDPSFPYVVEADIGIASGVTLNVDPGVVLKLRVARGWPTNDPDINVSGTLNLNGTAANPVVLSSYFDDTAGGDTNLDGVATGPAAGDWGRIRFNAGSAGTLSFVEARYGGGGNSGACCTANPPTDAIFSTDVTVTVSDSVFEFSQSDGGKINGGLGSLTNASFLNNAGFGLRFGNPTACANWTQVGLLYSGNGLGANTGC